jgi:hypothetical protein
MQRAKDHALSIIQNLPDTASYEDILYEIEFHREIAEGKDQIKHGASITHEEAMERLKKWLGESGHCVPSKSLFHTTIWLGGIDIAWKV